MTKLTVVPFSPRPVDPGRQDRILEIGERLADPDMRAAVCFIIDKDGDAMAIATTDDPMIVSYVCRMGERIVDQFLDGEVGFDDLELSDE